MSSLSEEINNTISDLKTISPNKIGLNQLSVNKLIENFKQTLKILKENPEAEDCLVDVKNQIEYYRKKINEVEKIYG